MSLKVMGVCVLVAVLGLSGCASTRTVPMKVQSDPLGAVVLMKLKTTDAGESEWIYLGNTPLTTQRRFKRDDLDETDVLTLRLIKDGYIEQTREWQGEELDELSGDEGPLFWNPKLVTSN